jgi:hypothetical protein
VGTLHLQRLALVENGGVEVRDAQGGILLLQKQASADQIGPGE